MQTNRLIYSLALLSILQPCFSQYEYSDLTSSYHLKWNGKCTSVPAGLNYNYRKGKSYEINHEYYLAFHTCKSSFSCDRSVEHAVRLDDYFRATSGCAQDYCDQCDGDKCSANCELYTLMAAATIEDGNSTYNGCSLTTSSEGLRYYYGPQCTNDGDLTMGYFFDKHCQLNATRRGNIYSPESFVAFNVFYFVQSICSDCSYFGVCEDIYNSSYTCTSSNGTLVSIGDNIEIEEEELEEEEEETDIDGIERRTEEGEAAKYDYVDDAYEQKEQQQEAAKQDDVVRSTTISFAEEVCLEIYTLEHIQDEIRRNVTVHFLRESRIVLEDLSIVACIAGAVLGVGFLFVAYTYYARHKSPWSQNKRGALADDFLNEGKSFDEISCDSTDDGFSDVDESSFPSPGVTNTRAIEL